MLGIFSWLDVVICAVLLIFFIFGLRRGFLLTVGDMVGLLLGAVAAFFAIPLVSTYVAHPWWRVALMAGTAAVLIILGQALGRVIATRIRHWMNVDFLRSVDRIAGGVLSTIIIATIIGGLAFSASSMGIPQVSMEIGKSSMIKAIRSVTPQFVNSAISSARSKVIAETLPAFLEPFAPQVEQQIDQNWQATDLQRTAAESAAKISGTAMQCGVNLTGSGFVVGPELVMTNAHVVAGLGSATVETGRDEVHRGRIVYFDPETDIALLYVEDLETPAIELAPDELTRGDSAAFIGYPAGGPQQIRSAVVASRANVSIANIYGEDPSRISVYQLSAEVAQGNSGGPLLDEQGEAVGLIFAKSRSDDQVGFALSLSEMEDALQTLGSKRTAVSTGDCVSG